MNDERLVHDFARELDEARRAQRLSFEKLAELSGVSKTYLRDLAAARRSQGLPSPEKVERIAAALGVRADHFRVTRARAVLAHPKAVDLVYAKLKR